LILPRNTGKYVRLCRLIGSVLLLAVLGWVTWDQTDVFTGHFFMRNASGTLRICLKTVNMMEEPLIPKYGAPRTIESTWRPNGAYVEFTPFVDFGAESIVVHTKWSALAQSDHNHNLQFFFYEDRALYFERDHPFTLAALLVYSPALVLQDAISFLAKRPPGSCWLVELRNGIKPDNRPAHATSLVGASGRQIVVWPRLAQKTGASFVEIEI
jgi:hypothetical protein